MPLRKMGQHWTNGWYRACNGSNSQLGDQFFPCKWAPNLNFLSDLRKGTSKDYKMTKTLRFHPKLNLMHSIKLCSIFCLCSFDFWGFCKDLTKMKLGWSQMLECCMFKLNQTNLSKQIHFWVQFKDMNTISLTVKLLVSGCFNLDF